MHNSITRRNTWPVICGIKTLNAYKTCKSLTEPLAVGNQLDSKQHQFIRSTILTSQRIIS